MSIDKITITIIIIMFYLCLNNNILILKNTLKYYVLSGSLKY